MNDIYKYQNAAGLGVDIHRHAVGDYRVDLKRIRSDGSLCVTYNEIKLKFMTENSAGLTNEALLAVVLDRLQMFAAAGAGCEENDAAARHINAAKAHIELAARELQDRAARMGEAARPCKN